MTNDKRKEISWELRNERPTHTRKPRVVSREWVFEMRDGKRFSMFKLTYADGSIGWEPYC